MTEAQREELARILEQVAAEGLHHPRSLDAALDSIDSLFPGPVLVAAEDHSYRWLNLNPKKVVVKDDFTIFEEYVGEEYVEEGYFVVEAWVAE